MQTVDPHTDTAVVCADGVCRLVPSGSLKRNSTPTVQPRTQSMPSGRSSGLQSGKIAQQRSQSARRLDVESADSDDEDGKAVHWVLASGIGLCTARAASPYPVHRRNAIQDCRKVM